MTIAWEWRLRRALAAATTIGAVGLLTLALAGAAYGKGEYEPNDSRDEAYGPISGGKQYVAEIDTENDVDWYLLYVKTYSQMDFMTTKLAGSGCNLGLNLHDKDGEYIDSFHTDGINETEHFYLTMSPGRYYLSTQVYCAPGTRYRFEISPASAITSSRECGEAIVARNEAAPELANIVGLIAKNTEALTKVEGVIAKQNARLTALTRQWRKLKRRWTRNGRRIVRSSRSRYQKKRAWRRLSASKRHANRRLAAAKQQPKAKLEKANGSRERILVKRLELQTLGAQHTVAVSGADHEIAEHC